MGKARGALAAGRALEKDAQTGTGQQEVYTTLGLPCPQTLWILGIRSERSYPARRRRRRLSKRPGQRTVRAYDISVSEP